MDGVSSNCVKYWANNVSPFHGEFTGPLESLTVSHMQHHDSNTCVPYHLLAGTFRVLAPQVLNTMRVCPKLATKTSSHCILVSFEVSNLLCEATHVQVGGGQRMDQIAPTKHL